MLAPSPQRAGTGRDPLRRTRYWKVAHRSDVSGSLGAGTAHAAALFLLGASGGIAALSFNPAIGARKNSAAACAVPAPSEPETSLRCATFQYRVRRRGSRP